MTEQTRVEHRVKHNDMLQDNPMKRIHAPAPDGPMIAVVSPAGTSPQTLSINFRGPFLVLSVMLTCRHMRVLPTRFSKGSVEAFKKLPLLSRFRLGSTAISTMSMRSKSSSSKCEPSNDGIRLTGAILCSVQERKVKTKPDRPNDVSFCFRGGSLTAEILQIRHLRCY